MAHANVALNFNAFLEKTKLKDDGSNYTDWVRNLRIILIAAQKNYVLEAPLGARPAADATNDVKNVWQSKANDYSIVQCAMLYGLEPGLQRRFERHGASLQKKYTSVMIRVCHGRSRFLSCMYIHDDFMTESR